MIPAHQCLVAHDAFLEQVHDGLVVHHETIPAQAVAQLAFDRQPFHGIAVRLLVEELPPPAARGLGLEQGRVGVPQQFGGRGDSRGQADTDAATGHHAVPQYLHRRGDRLQDPLRDQLHLLGAADVRDDDHELVTAESSEMSALRQLAADALRHRRQHPVAGTVTQRVVDHLEVVQVDEQHPDLPVRGASGQLRLQRVLDPGQVVQTGQFVVVALVLQAFPGLVFSAAVLDLHEQAVGFAVLVAHQHCRAAHPHDGPVGTDHPELTDQGVAVPVGKLLAVDAGDVPVLGVNDRDQRPRGEPVRIAQQHRLEGTVDQSGGAVQAHDCHPDRRFGNHRAHEVLGVPQCFGLRVALGHVPPCEGDGVAEPHAAQVESAHVVGSPHGVVEIVFHQRFTRFDDLRIACEQPSGTVRGQPLQKAPAHQCLGAATEVLRSRSVEPTELEVDDLRALADGGHDDEWVCERAKRRVQQVVAGKRAVRQTGHRTSVDTCVRFSAHPGTVWHAGG